MIEKKDMVSSSKPVSFRLKSEIIDVLNALVGTDIKCADCGKQLVKLDSKTDIIEESLAGLVRFVLRTKIADEQVKVFSRSPRQLFRLYLMVHRAEQGEKGYCFTDKGRKRWVHGPEPDRVYTHMFEQMDRHDENKKDEQVK
jgi:hypothetical protein